MKTFKLPEDILIQSISLKVEDNEKMLGFYKNQLGFVLKSEENNLSILGSKKKNSRLIILEQHEEPNIVSQHIPVHFTLLIPTENNFFNIAQRLHFTGYPVETVHEEFGRQIICVSDPEKNQIEIIYEKNMNGSYEVKEELTIKMLAEKSMTHSSNLHHNTSITRICLPVNKEKTSSIFYEDILGMKKKEQCFILQNETISLHLKEKQTGFPVKEGKHRTGINFFVLLLKDSSEIEKLGVHLEQQEVDFFVDYKRTILTIFDPDGIEWWFVSK